MTDTSNPAPAAGGQPWSLYVGDARTVLAGMPAGSANCIVTSPPYWGKRDYGVAGQYGHEDTPAAYVDTMRDVFREARRVLADDGTCWLNLGDSYSASGGGATGMHAYLGEHLTTHRASGLGAKNLLGLPWRVALALQDDGWILRNAVVWHKPNAMPESVRDRLYCRHELLFLLAKSPSYWFDLNPIREPHKTADTRRERQRSRTRPPGRPGGRTRPPKYGPGTPEVTGCQPVRRAPGAGHRRAHPNGRNPGDVWSIPTRPYKGPHFAAYPIDLPLRCIAAGCKPGGTVLDPFAGSGTTGLAAIQLGRRFTGIDLSPDFARLAAGRLAQAVADRRRAPDERQPPSPRSPPATTSRGTSSPGSRRSPRPGWHLAAHRPSARRPARRPGRPRPGAGRTRGGPLGPGEPARRDPRDPRAPTPRASPTRSATCATNSKQPAPRRALGGGHEQLPADPPADPPRPQAPACSPSSSSTARSPCPPRCSSARLAWRYRSEIAPATTAGAVLAAGWWLHHGHPGLWPWLLAVSDLAASRSWSSARASACDRLAERVYAAVAVLAAGGWLAVAALLGPFTRPMPQALASARSCSRSPGGHTGAAAHGHACSARSPPGRTSPKRSACRVPRSSPRASTYGDGGRGSGWRAGRRSPT